MPQIIDVRWKPLLLVLALIAVVIVINLTRLRSSTSPTTAQPELTDITAIDRLKIQFNQSVGKPRLILLLSPTGPHCMLGARWVQEELLTKYPADDVQVLTVWQPMFGNEKRSDWSADRITDPRALHYWDGDLVIGMWFAEKMEGGCCGDVAWDGYYLFPPEARWDDLPAPLTSKGFTVYTTREQLEKDLTELWSKGPLGHSGAIFVNQEPKA